MLAAQRSWSEDMCSPGPTFTVVECSTELWRQLGSPVPDLMRPYIQLESFICCTILSIILAIILVKIRSPITTQHHSLQSTGLSSGAKMGTGVGVAIAGLLILADLVFFVPQRRRKATDRETEREGLRQAIRNHIFASQQQEPIAEMSTY